jgi:hypothetical protein
VRAPGNPELGKCEFCSDYGSICTKDDEWEPCPKCQRKPEPIIFGTSIDGKFYPGVAIKGGLVWKGHPNT